MRAHDHAFAVERSRDRGDEIRERLPHSGAGLRDQRAAVAERAFDRAGEGALLRAVLVPREATRERAIGREHRLDGDAGAQGRGASRSRRRREARRLPRAAHRPAQGAGEERGVRRPEERRVRLHLLEDRDRQLARAASEIREHRGACERVV